MGTGCQGVTQVDQCSLEQYYVRSSMLRALIYNQARAPVFLNPYPFAMTQVCVEPSFALGQLKHCDVCMCMPCMHATDPPAPSVAGCPNVASCACIFACMIGNRNLCLFHACPARCSLERRQADASARIFLMQAHQ